ncbi:hypothetical protein [Carboxylicivirga taeanensis]|uniref:hypothetical protein n=1 Tax=Carboxylicivirga taeanensis TaxID=1416875 RepID=UPI003F6DA552
MKNGNKLFWVVLLAAVIGSFGYRAAAQTQKQKKVTVKVISGDTDSAVKLDTTFSGDGIKYSSSSEIMVINLDSIMQANHEEIEKHMRVMALKMDSLNEWSFKGDFECLHKEVDELLKENGLRFKHEGQPGRVLVLRDNGEEVDIEEFINEEVELIKIIESHSGSIGHDECATQTIVITEGADGKMPFIHKHAPGPHGRVRVEPIPLEDISFLKQIGISTKMLVAEPLTLEELTIEIEKIMEDEKLQTYLKIECDLPAGTYDFNVYNGEGLQIKEQKNIKGDGPLKEDVKLKKEEAPYYMILTKNNQLLGRKIVL